MGKSNYNNYKITLKIQFWKLVYARFKMLLILRLILKILLSCKRLTV